MRISIPFIELATVVYVLVDDWYKEYGVRLIEGSRKKASIK